MRSPHVARTLDLDAKRRWRAHLRYRRLLGHPNQRVRSGGARYRSNPVCLRGVSLPRARLRLWANGILNLQRAIGFDAVSNVVDATGLPHQNLQPRLHLTTSVAPRSRSVTA